VKVVQSFNCSRPRDENEYTSSSRTLGMSQLTHSTYGVGVLLAGSPRYTSRRVVVSKDPSRSECDGARNTKIQKVRAAGAQYPMSCVVVCIALGVIRYFEGVPARPYISWGDRVTWKVLAEYK